MRHVVNNNEIRIIGMSRSGNHALIQWILGQLPGTYCFLNCCEPGTNPYETARPLDDGRCVRTNVRGLDLASEAAGRFAPKDWLLFNHEDTFLRRACGEAFEEQHDRWVGPSGRRTDVLIVRDPYNLFASRLRSGVGSVTPTTSVRIWKQHARQLLRGPRQLRHNPVLVLYNRWVTDRGYRGALAARLGIPFTDAGIDRVARCAGGSSFDGRAFDGMARRMDVFGRWRDWVDEPSYRALFDEDVMAMSRALFGDVVDDGAFDAVAMAASG
jgi:hypothetical protein